MASQGLSGSGFGRGGRGLAILEALKKDPQVQYNHSFTCTNMQWSRMAFSYFCYDKESFITEKKGNFNVSCDN